MNLHHVCVIYSRVLQYCFMQVVLWRNFYLLYKVKFVYNVCLCVCAFVCLCFFLMEIHIFPDIRSKFCTLPKLFPVGSAVYVATPNLELRGRKK
jgi:hypothetical protein